ncbi:protein kinase [Mycobacterium sp. CVI_P3]|uniref:Protein kinase n=1 Tax=Mycobacterium pinniadriaticum TaxID=2994102 RepID=A0ABT3SG02_9MYCO|nr:protein kinase [Mycobacterium pinniadriaticum]MCX2932023.1 protein kinase [Mycobacterium pinniadriaticum]MCX2938447.1 protein kinase [Mycobacterium pinniadriaticum]
MSIEGQLGAAGFDDIDEIGRGGFGIVFRCTEVALGRIVAVKVLTADLQEDRERFLREQRAMAKLTGHPNIVGVLEVGETAGDHPYLVMQYHAQGSLEDRIKRLGLLPLDEALRVGVKMAGALESAHRLGILHRDVKPANILLTAYGQPALSDFGIAHIAGGFQTAAGNISGSPAFIAPEILAGDPPNQASDVYGLGASLFAMLTGHAAFERHADEQIVAQFLRIAGDPVPDLRDRGVPADVAAVVEKAMSRNPADRPSVVALGEELQRVQAAYGFPVDEMALRDGDQDSADGHRADKQPARARRVHGSLPAEITSFIGRDVELGQLARLLASSRMVTLIGLGGVGKTRLARRAAAQAQAQGDFPDGVRMIEMGELRDGSLLVDVVAAGLGLRDEAARPLHDVLVDFLAPRRLLLVLDNCEQLVADVARLTEELLRECPHLRVLATSRERLGVYGEAVEVVAPLAFPDIERIPRIDSLGEFDAIALFCERAAAAVQEFHLTEDNKTMVAGIVSRLEGLPLAIELAAARLRAMSLDQLLERLADRYRVLTHGSRGAPRRQQALSWTVAWSYDLCTPAEQRLWGRLSVFAGVFELEAAQYVCGADVDEDEFLDLVTALVDKSILIRTESNNVVRFRLLETLREYGRFQIEQNADYRDLRLRHAEWYQRLARDAFDGWFSPRQLDWLDRIRREMPNIREALEFSLSEDGTTALGTAAALQPFWLCRGMLREARHWTDRALDRAPREPTRDRVQALFSSALIMPLYGDLSGGAARAAEARALVEKTDDPVAHAGVSMADGIEAIMRGDFHSATTHLEEALKASDDPNMQVNAMLLLGWALEFAGDTRRALSWQEKALALATSRGEKIYRSYALWELGIRWLQHGRTGQAEELLQEGLRFAQQIDDQRNAAGCLEGLAWIAARREELRAATVMMGAADALARAVGSVAVPLPRLQDLHADCERRAREALGCDEFTGAHNEGGAMSLDEAVTYALDGHI